MRIWKQVSISALLIGVAGCANVGSTSSSVGPFEGLRYQASFNAADNRQDEMKLAAAALAGGDVAGAIRIYRRVAQKFPNAVEPRLELGEALLAANAPEEAARAFGGAARLESKNYNAISGLARAQLAIRQPAEALNLFEAALEIRPTDALARNGKAVALDQLGRHEEAQQIYLQLLDRDPTNIKVRSNYGLSLALQGREDEAADVLASLSAAPDAEPKIRQNLALAYGLAGNDGQAAHISRIDLDEDAVQNNLGYFQRLRNVSGAVNRVAAFSAPPRQPVTPAFSHAASSRPASEWADSDSAPLTFSAETAEPREELFFEESRTIAPTPIVPLVPDQYAGAVLDLAVAPSLMPNVESAARNAAVPEMTTVAEARPQLRAVHPDVVLNLDGESSEPAVPALH